MKVIPLFPTRDRQLPVAVDDGVAVSHRLADRSVATALDVLVESACELLDVDYAGVHAIDAERHTVLAGSSDIGPVTRPRFDSLCGVLLDRHVPPHAADDPPLGTVIEVRDTAMDPTLPLVLQGLEEAPVRFYAGTPLLAEGVVIGTLCVIAHQPRALTPLERRTLLLLGVAAARILSASPGR